MSCLPLYSHTLQLLKQDSVDRRRLSAKSIWPASSYSVCAEYCTDVRESGVGCSMKFRHEAGRVTGTPVAAPGPGQYAVTTCDRPRSAAFTFGCSRPQSGSQTVRFVHVIGNFAALPGKRGSCCISCSCSFSFVHICVLYFVEFPTCQTIRVRPDVSDHNCPPPMLVRVTAPCVQEMLSVHW